MYAFASGSDEEVRNNTNHLVFDSEGPDFKTIVALAGTSTHTVTQK